MTFLVIALSFAVFYLIVQERHCHVVSKDNKRLKIELEEIKARERFLIARVRTLETRIK